MKGRGKLIFGLLLGGILGWTLGYLRLPLIEGNGSFWIGLLAGGSAALLILMLRKVFGTVRAQKPVSSSIRWISLTITFVISGTLLIVWIMSIQYQNRVTLGISEELRLTKLEALVIAQDQANLGKMIQPLVKEIQEEVSENPMRSLSSETIEKISRLSHTFVPYSYLSQDTLQSKKLSPQRGQLLLALLSINMDTTALRQILSKVSFAGADLQGAKLTGLDLSGIDLRSANLENASLDHTYLVKADLRRANLWGAHLNHARMRSADLRRVNFEWTEINQVDLRSTYLDGAIFSHAVVRNTDASESVFQWGEMSDVTAIESNFSHVDFEKTKMQRANFSGSIFTNSNLRRADIIDANFNGTELSNVSIARSDWIDMLTEWRVLGAEEIRQKFQVKNDSIFRR